MCPIVAVSSLLGSVVWCVVSGVPLWQWGTPYQKRCPCVHFCLRPFLPLPAGDHTPDLAALLAADVIIATPEKWDGISRNWQTRGYVKKVCVGWPGVCCDVPRVPTWHLSMRRCLSTALEHARCGTLLQLHTTDIAKQVHHFARVRSDGCCYRSCCRRLVPAAVTAVPACPRLVPVPACPPAPRLVC